MVDTSQPYKYQARCIERWQLSFEARICNKRAIIDSNWEKFEVKRDEVYALVNRDWIRPRREYHQIEKLHVFRIISLNPDNEWNPGIFPNRRFHMPRRIRDRKLRPNQSQQGVATEVVAIAVAEEADVSRAQVAVAAAETVWAVEAAAKKCISKNSPSEVKRLLWHLVHRPRQLLSPPNVDKSSTSKCSAKVNACANANIAPTQEAKKQKMAKQMMDTHSEEGVFGAVDFRAMIVYDEI